ncbi:amino acid/amide ABC transporter substrate-binding protein, HAAT family (TC 3.A.1.4.-) [Bradyrhizobium sp. NFR13]|jgi:branched-chain amino acid transport system substrate-binding protein|uniref:ABC transporter substrate-binding protein n=1 Tax=Bradyrhizobium sp. NFR13 TaxID=1566285 RepID=UPI0008DF1F68|nr:ABC transporter substrate-binding protein [Bradyrhizobium sp. NFR13]SFL62692.1 amino acid/amide ABC transporter substrate-binding protein, HAAT family (TC 3.A.1.4.-) [Bradyrhizobium sp. NFR13]
MKKAVSTSLLGLALMMSASSLAFAQDKTAKIGVLNDQSGLYADVTGPGSVVAAQMAVEDSGLLAKGWKIDVVIGDHQNKPDVGSNIARQWFDVDKVDAIVDVPTSSVGLVVNNIVKEKNGVYLNSGSGTSDLSNAQCSPNTIHWAYDTFQLANGTGSAMVKNGGDTWFFLTADYAFGTALERDTTNAVTAKGGKIIGSVRPPLNTADFSSFLLQAQASKAKVIGLANAGGDTINSIKQASEFGIVKGGQKLAGLLMFITDVHALGLPVANGLSFTETFYWDLNDGTRGFSKRFQARMKNKNMPTTVQAGVYSSLIHYFKTLDAMGGNSHDGLKIVNAMKAAPTDDIIFGKGTIQPNGRKLHPAYLFEVKKPEESKGPWDYYKLVATIPADQAFTPLDKSACPLLKKT